MNANKIWDIAQAGVSILYFKNEGLKNLKKCLTKKEYKAFVKLLKEKEKSDG